MQSTKSPSGSSGCEDPSGKNTKTIFCNSTYQSTLTFIFHHLCSRQYVTTGEEEKCVSTGEAAGGGIGVGGGGGIVRVGVGGRVGVGERTMSPFPHCSSASDLLQTNLSKHNHRLFIRPRSHLSKSSTTRLFSKSQSPPIFGSPNSPNIIIIVSPPLRASSNLSDCILAPDTIQVAAL